MVRASISKSLITPSNALKRRMWCREYKNWTHEQGEDVIWSDKPSFKLFPTNGCVYVLRIPPVVKLTAIGLRLSIAAIQCWCGVQYHIVVLNPLVALNGRVTVKYYVSILTEHHPLMVQTGFPDKRTVFQDDNALTHTCRIAKDWFLWTLRWNRAPHGATSVPWFQYYWTLERYFGKLAAQSTPHPRTFSAIWVGTYPSECCAWCIVICISLVYLY